MMTAQQAQSPRITTRALTAKQAATLWVVQQNEPASAADVANHMLVSASAARSALNRLEREGLVGRQYTGHHRQSQFAFYVTGKGEATLDRSEWSAWTPEDWYAAR